MSDAGVPRRRALQRRQRANVPGGRPIVHQVWLSATEEARLVVLAAEQNVTVSRLLAEAALSSSPSATPTQRNDLTAQFFRAQRLVAGIANNVNQIARATNARGEVPAEADATLIVARRFIAELDAAIERLIDG